MDTQELKLTGSLRLYKRYILFCLLISLTSIAFAQNTDQVCQQAKISQELNESGVTGDREQLRKIQSALSEYGYGELILDGTKGPATLAALERLCVDFGVTATQNLAAQLLSLLELTGMVWQEYPEWRQLIQSDEFKSWLQQQPKAEQEKMSDTLQSGPADEVIAILGASGIKPVAPEQAAPASVASEAAPAPTIPEPESEPAPAPPMKKCEYAPATVSGPAVFYRWQSDKEESEGTEDDSAQECEDVQLSDDVLAVLDALEGVAYSNEFLFQCALAAHSKAFKCELPLQNQTQLQNQVAQQALNGPVEEPKQIKLSGDCGCSRDFSSLVYGFYPYWLASDDVQQVNFSLFDRLGYYALTLNQDNGRIEDPLQWSDTGGAAALIKIAHKYRVEVDLTIYASDWQQWTDEVINIAAENVATVATQQLHSRYTKGLRAVFPFLGSTASVTADGVTLFFDNYTASSSSKKIVSFMTRVSEALDRAGADTRLNIMLGLDMNTIEQQPLFEDLACILLDDGIKGKQEACILQGEKDSQVKIHYIFTHLQEPTTNSKKTLRRKIENDFQGLQRKTVLRKVIPIISPYGHDRDPRGAFDQFSDDLIYFQDNFKGVGLWPLPLVGDNDMQTIEKIIIDRFTEADGSIHLGQVIDTYTPWLCEFACPNRFWFRVSFDLLAGLLLVYALLAIWMCRLRSLYRQYFLYFLAVGLVAVLIALISLVCDPFWQDKADGVVITVFLIALIATIWKYVSKATQPPLP